MRKQITLSKNSIQISLIFILLSTLFTISAWRFEDTSLPSATIIGVETAPKDTLSLTTSPAPVLVSHIFLSQRISQTENSGKLIKLKARKSLATIASKVSLPNETRNLEGTKTDTSIANDAIDALASPEREDTQVKTLPVILTAPPQKLEPLNPTLYLRPTITPAYVNFVAQHEIKKGNIPQASMALTFDCEADIPSMKQMLNTLAKHSVRGTFFLPGNFVTQHPNVVPMVLEGGHELGNHSYSHPNFTSISQTVVISELQRAEAAISRAAGKPVPMRYFRFPYGARNAQVRQWVAEQGYQSIFWSIDPQGWRSSITVTAVISNVLAEAQPGGIVLMHCNKTDAQALAGVITGLQAKGYTLENLTAILSQEQIYYSEQ